MMIEFVELIGLALAYGGLISLLLSILIIVNLFNNAEIWVGDYPPDIKEKFGQMDQSVAVQRLVVSLLFFSFLIVPLFQFVRNLMAQDASFIEVFIGCMIVLTTFNLVDLLFLDWLIFVYIQPSFIILAGTNGMDGYKDYRFHFIAFLKGMVLIIVFSAFIGFITVFTY